MKKHLLKWKQWGKSALIVGALLGTASARAEERVLTGSDVAELRALLLASPQKVGACIVRFDTDQNLSLDFVEIESETASPGDYRDRSVIFFHMDPVHHFGFTYHPRWSREVLSGGRIRYRFKIYQHLGHSSRAPMDPGGAIHLFREELEIEVLANSPERIVKASLKGFKYLGPLSFPLAVGNISCSE